MTGGARKLMRRSSGVGEMSLIVFLFEDQSKNVAVYKWHVNFVLRKGSFRKPNISESGRLREIVKHP